MTGTEKVIELLGSLVQELQSEIVRLRQLVDQHEQALRNVLDTRDADARD